MQFARKSLLGATTALSLVTIAGCGIASAATNASALATVNGQAITGPQWKQSMEAISLLSGQPIPKVTLASKKRQVQELMQWSAVEQWAISHHLITLPKARSMAKGAIATIEKQAGSKATLVKQLKSYHLTLSEFTSFMVNQEKLEAAYTYSTKSLKPPPVAQEKAFYKANGSYFAVPATDQVRAILVKSDTQAKTLESDITSGSAKFSALAKKYSLDKTSAKAGGSLGSLTLSSTNGLPATFTQVMKTLKAGQYGIAKTSSGYYLMQVQKVNPASEQSFTSVKSQIASSLQQTDASAAFTKFGTKILAHDKSHLNLK